MNENNGNDQVMVRKNRLDYLTGIERENFIRWQEENAITTSSFAPGVELKFSENSQWFGTYRIIGSGLKRNGEPFLWCAMQTDAGPWILTTFDVSDIADEQEHGEVQVTCAPECGGLYAKTE